MSARGLSWAVAALALAACNDSEPMQIMARDNPYSEDPYFADARAMRPTVPGTVAQEWYRRQGPYVPLGAPDGGLMDLEGFPVPLTREVLLRGRSQFENWCSPCHGLLADGQSIVGRNMRLRPPPALYGPLHTPHPARGATEVDGGLTRAGSGEGAGPLTPGWDALPHPPGFYYQVISGGYGLMPSYAVLKPEDRWAVVAWLRVLAFSQRAPLSAAPPEVRASLQQQPGSGGTP
ncbi:cytochrome c [Pyxidicoccus parkwayensis]|uniref:Cytochrome c n=1 Tax=Pyxidicoccus parkwayensis TaxID=2813578 RepID=A0ABX7NY12_9BACT|nr:cytochrome c [Pyxidicoccus parkwaysis]QSQ23705.1 cytochrome c [Pyxidicoccus parkwaysis]